MAKKLSVGQNALFNSVGAMFYLGCQWLITVLVVKLGSYEAAGHLSLAMSITNIFFTIASFGGRTFQASDYQEKYKTATYVSTRLFTCLCATLLCAVTVFFNRHYTPYQMACILLYMLFRAAEALIDTFQAIQQKQDRMDYTFFSFLLRGVFILGGFSAVMAITGNLLAAIALMALLSFGTALCFDWQVAKKLTGFRLSFSWRSSRALLLECIPLMCDSLLAAAVISIPRSTLESLWGAYYLGIYASIATPAVIVQTAAQWIYAPTITTFTRHYAQGNKKGFYQLYFKLWLIIAFCVAVVCAAAKLFGAWGLELLFDAEIVAYSYLLIPVLLTTILIACNYFIGALLIVTRHLKIIVGANAVSVALVAIFSTPLVTHFGMAGVNYVIYLAMGVNAAILFVALTLVLHRRFKQQ